MPTRSTLQATGPLVLQGDHGYSRKSEHGQASYYYSQPFFDGEGTLTIDGRSIEVTGHAWMDREWSSQPLAADQKGWDWFSLHLERREADAVPVRGASGPFRSGTGSTRMAHRIRSHATTSC